MVKHDYDDGHVRHAEFFEGIVEPIFERGVRSNAFVERDGAVADTLRQVHHARVVAALVQRLDVKLVTKARDAGECIIGR